MTNSTFRSICCSRDDSGDLRLAEFGETPEPISCMAQQETEESSWVLPGGL